MYRAIIGIVVVSFLSGCAAFSQTFFSRDVVEDIPGEYFTLALTSERRLALFQRDSKRACAEALPDVAVASDVESSLKAAIDAGSVKLTDADLKETIKETLTIAYQRTETSDLVRQLGWQVCQAYLNEAISADQYHKILQSMVVAVLINPGRKSSGGEAEGAEKLIGEILGL